MAVLRDANTGREYALNGSVLIGRDLACDIRVGAGQASRRHARILREDGAFFIEDLGSVNGTLVNGKLIQARTRLYPRDRIEISGLTVTFHKNCAAIEHEPAEAASHSAMSDNLNNITTTLNIDASLRVSSAPEIKLRALLEISKNLSHALHLETVLPKILESLFKVFPQADRGCVLLFDPRTGQLRPRVMWHRREGPDGRPRRPCGGPDETPVISQSILNHALQTGQALLSADAGHDERFDVTQSVRRLHLRSLMCVPMLSQEGAPLGVIQIDGQNPIQTFGHEDLDLLVCIATQAAHAIELAQMYEARRDQEATEIQKSFLPSQRPRIEGLNFFDHYASAQNIGGDYYDYIPLPNDRLAVVVGDVAGKGVSAALLMARLSAFARFYLASEPDVPRAFALLNAALSHATPIDRFVTFLAAVIDLKTFRVTLVNAGHPPPLRKRGNQVEEIGKESAGLPLAVRDQPYEAASVTLDPGDVLILYTDGLTEARNPQQDFFGLNRLRNVIESVSGDMEVLGQAILDDVHSFIAGRPRSDDLTLACVSRIG